MLSRIKLFHHFHTHHFVLKASPKLPLSEEKLLPDLQFRSLQLHARWLQISCVNGYFKPHLYISQESSSAMALHSHTSSCTFFGVSPLSSRIFLSMSVHSSCGAINPPSWKSTSLFVFFLAAWFFPPCIAPTVVPFRWYSAAFQHLKPFSSFAHVLCCSLMLIYSCQGVCVPANIANILSTCDTRSTSRHLQKPTLMKSCPLMRAFLRFRSFGFNAMHIHFRPLQAQGMFMLLLSLLLAHLSACCFPFCVYFVLVHKRSTFLSV